jgi:rare lipoprotein A (peptidoglycan hydrolase)
MLEQVILLLSMLASGHLGLGTVFGSSRWDRGNPHSRLACLHREINDRKDLVIAHNTLPCGTRVWIYNPRTGLSTVARVQDRGPRHAYADLSRAVAKRIAHNGHEPVFVMELPPVGGRRSWLGNPLALLSDEADPDRLDDGDGPGK